MKIIVLSRSSWNEPHRIRQQLAKLIAEKYQIIYATPRADLGPGAQQRNITFKNFPFIEKYSSVPLVSIVNAFFIWIYLNFQKDGVVVINFLPELVWVPKKIKRVISVINDDFSSMAPKITRWWMRFIIERMAKNSYATLYVSKALIKKYPSKHSILFHPWADKISFFKKEPNIILYWGYISTATDIGLIAKIADQIEKKSLNLKLLLIGPLASKKDKQLSELIDSHPRILEYRTPRGLSEIEMESVLCGLEPLSQGFENANFVEMPNKAPRLLSYGVPIVYSGCVLENASYFIKYEGDIEKIAFLINLYKEKISCDIDDFFLKNSSRSRLKIIDELINFREGF